MKKDDIEQKQWIELIEEGFSNRWKSKELSVDKKHPYILDPKIWKANLYPLIRETVDNLEIKYHYRNNPKSSQILAINLFLPLKSIKFGFLNSFFGEDQKSTPEIIPEWPDNEDLLLQHGMKSQHDVLVEFGTTKYLIEVKYAEHTAQPCGTKLKNKECKKTVSQINCPLSEKYDTRYYEILRAEDSPYDIDKINKLFKTCPFLVGGQYQIMRYIFLCHLKNLNHSPQETWHPVIMYPKENNYIESQVQLTKSFMKNPDNLMTVYVNDYVKALEKWHENLYSWLTGMYGFVTHE